MRAGRASTAFSGWRRGATRWLLLAGTLLALAGCDRSASAPPPVPVTPMTASFAIAGMHCDGCAGHIQEVVSGKPGVTSCTVSFERQRAEVAYDAARTNPAAIVAAVKEAGYVAELAPADPSPPPANPPAD